MGFSYGYERIQNDPQSFALDSVQQQSLRSQQLDVRWFVTAQWTLNCSWSHNQVAGSQQSHDDFFTPMLVSYQDSFNQVDANLNWKFSGSGLLTAGVRNATNAHFQYTEIDKLSPRFSNGRLVYATLKLGW